MSPCPPVHRSDRHGMTSPKLNPQTEPPARRPPRGSSGQTQATADTSVPHHVLLAVSLKIVDRKSWGRPGTEELRQQSPTPCSLVPGPQDDGSHDTLPYLRVTRLCLCVCRRFRSPLFRNHPRRVPRWLDLPFLEWSVCFVPDSASSD